MPERAAALVGLCLALWGTGCGGRGVVEDVTTVPVGAGAVEVVVTESGRPGRTFLSLHDDENTAVEAARAVIRRHGGRLVELRHTGERNITFTLGDTTYTFDPNRMFTPAGIEATLRRFGAFSPAAAAEVRRLAEAVLVRAGLDTLSLVVAVHNNTDENYSAASYLPGGSEDGNAVEVFIADGSDPDDFFFVTERGLFEVVRAAGFNVVLQDNARATDDGSLSVYCGRRGIPYVNVEAEYGHRDVQERMLAFLVRIS
ncbi:hypothetical protein GQ464_001135 [Rhodocaloribacter litoris]|uniref:protein tyrosine phosphatase n=1 Tax=Rhodocaloribacter litoris TaxID=2558931 RepID=UPI00142183F4|nr:protein tyrosine phosphatase [Rhodocaloribacter litoris]QXD15577.1 hypothetical protein GQ464_001135 [Rhodocaloribacter litoris]